MKSCSGCWGTELNVVSCEDLNVVKIRHALHNPKCLWDELKRDAGRQKRRYTGNSRHISDRDPNQFLIEKIKAWIEVKWDYEWTCLRGPRGVEWSADSQNQNLPIISRMAL